MVGDSVTGVLRGVAGSVVRSAKTGTKIMYIDTFSPLPFPSFMQRLVHLTNNAILPLHIPKSLVLHPA